MRFLVVTVALAGCGLSPQQYCTESAKAICQKTFQCATTDFEKAALAFIYSSEQDCVDKSMAAYSCSSIRDQDVCNGRGAQAWDANAANGCVGRVKGLSCAEASNGTGAASCGTSDLCKP